jgi:limonene-1,2-epoxide hydrolase
MPVRLSRSDVRRRESADNQARTTRAVAVFRTYNAPAGGGIVAGNASIAAAFMTAMKNKDLSQAPLAANACYTGPLAGEPVHGREHIARFLHVYLPVIHEIRLLRQIADGDHVAAVWEADPSFGVVSVVYVFRIEADEIAEIQAFYDPRGFLERMGMWTGV